jgi:iron complex outermembrane receptor protein
VLVNAPTHKALFNLAYRGKLFFGNFFTRWVQSYNYFSSFQIASETLVRDDGTPFLYRGVPIVENARSADAFNYGPLGGFVTFDISAGVRVDSWLTASFNVTNLFNTEMREFTAAPPTGRLFSVELRFDIPAIAPKKR